MTQELTAPIQQAWLGLAQMRVNLTKELEALALSAQQVLLTPAVSITEREVQLREHSKAVKAITDARLNSLLTQKIKALQKDLMKFEEDAAGDPRIAELQAELLALKKQEADKVAAANARNLELSQFKAHVQNEYHRIVTEFKAAAWQEIQTMYRMALDTKDPELMTPTCETINSRLAFPITQVFQAKYITNEDKDAIKKQIAKPEFNRIRGDMVQECIKLFSNYESDLAAGTAPVITEAADLKADYELSKAINDIAAETVPELSVEGKAVKKLISIEVVETQAFAMAVITHFLKINGWTWLKGRNKFSTLTVLQMSEALSRYATENSVTHLEGLTLKQVEKL